MGNDESKIRKIIDKRINAIKNKDIDKATIDYSSDVIFYDMVDPLEQCGMEGIRNRLKDLLKQIVKIVDYEIIKTDIHISKNVAFHSGLNHIKAITADMNDLDMWWRETSCYLKIKGIWKISHSHISVPFDAESGIASVGLKPDQ